MAEAAMMMKCEPMDIVQDSGQNGAAIKKETSEDVVKTKFDESYMPVAGLQLQSEEDGYRYYIDVKTQAQYSLDEAGSADPPRDANDQPYFPVDDKGNPVFPYDFEKKQWTFPVDDTDEPIFPRNALNKPIVPEDDRGRPIFPTDKKGIYIFPLDEHNCPTPAITLSDGKPVVPKDEYGSFVIPRDREGKALIHIAPDGITPMSVSEYKYYKQYYKEHAKISTSISKFNKYQLLTPLDRCFTRLSYPTLDGIKKEVSDSTQAEQTKESDKLLKRKKFLSAQLNFTKRLGVPPKTSSNGQKEEENGSSKPVSTQELIEAVKKSIGSKKAELKAQVVEKHKSVEQTKVSSKRKHSSGSRSASSDSSGSSTSRHRHNNHSSRNNNSSKKSRHSPDNKKVKGRYSPKLIPAIWRSTGSKFQKSDIGNLWLGRVRELESVRKCIRQTRKKYDSVKKQITVLEKEKSIHKRNLIKLLNWKKESKKKMVMNICPAHLRPHHLRRPRLKKTTYPYSITELRSLVYPHCFSTLVTVHLVLEQSLTNEETKDFLFT
uniref:Uncharacterized protein n=1 Tax=Ditylenchus dipsaci TaxID=166011 RepID=A0A915EGZ3_9BILA